jgi:histidine triad (HIT) family protein
VPSIFSKIAAGQVPCARVWENDEFLAFLDIQPVAPGHTLVIPKKEVDYFFDLDEVAYARLMEACRVIAIGLKKATGCRRVCMAVFGFEVPHAHVHLIPMQSLVQFPFPARQKAGQEVLEAMAGRIRQELAASGGAKGR